MKNKNFLLLLKSVAIAGNSIFIAWILYKGLNEELEGSLIKKFTYVGLIVLLAINILLLLRNGKT